MDETMNRRGLILGAGAALGAFGAAAWLTASGGGGERAAPGSPTVDLVWQDLMPGGDDPLRQTFADLGISEEGQMLGLFEQGAGSAVTTAFNGQRVRIPGYMVPMEFLSTGVREFLLVPYVGACIHVPPPPPNQIILVTAEAPYETTGYFDPIYVEGVLSTEARTTDLAEVGYVIAGAAVRPYG